MALRQAAALRVVVSLKALMATHPVDGDEKIAKGCPQILGHSNRNRVQL